MPPSALLFLSALVATGLLTGCVRAYARARNLIDIPNDRSSHVTPTPRGGGLALIIVTMVTLSLLAREGHVSTQVLIALSGGGLTTAIIGLLDDHVPIAARWRLAGHCLAVAWGLYWLGGLPPIVLWSQALNLGLIGHMIAALFLVWLLNLYNFMDGINGIAAIELITVAIGGLALAGATGVRDAQPLLLTLIASGLGFLVWNFPRARIFMGDAGSGFVGLILGLIAIWQGALQPELFIAWVILLGTFIMDSTVTLLRRVLRGKVFYAPHRSHAYQVAARHYASHTPVSLAVGLINLAWLTPMAVIAADASSPPVIILIIAWGPLLALSLRFNAGAAG